MYQAKEAFCIMTYQCTNAKCGKTEELYNGRDGVTPFGIACRYCGEIANHINWRCDIQNENFTPFPGMRVFTDYTPERAREAAIRSIAKLKGTDYEIAEGTKDYDESLRHLTERYMNDCCAVDILIHGKEFLIFSELCSTDFQSIISAPRDGTSILLWHKDWIDEDFNPTGVIDGFFNDEYGWTGAVWNGCQDVWDTRDGLEPSHWMPKAGPSNA